MEDNKLKDENDKEISTRKHNALLIEKLREKHKPLRNKVYIYLILLVLFVLYQYLLTPFAFVIELIFLTNSIEQETGTTESKSIQVISQSINIIGWLVLFVLPLITFIIHGLSIVIIQDTLILKFWIVIVTLLESILNIPLTFLYKNNLYSIFLYQERGFNQSLNPWIVFYPTKLIKSWVEIVKMFITSLFFFIVGIYAYSKIKTNISKTFIVAISLTMIIVNLIRMLALVCIIIFKCTTQAFYDSDEAITSIEKSN